MHNLSYLREVLILLIASIITVVSLRKLKLSPVLGYLVIGALIGPHGMNLVEEHEYSNRLAEFGVVFLVFVIGLEMTFERLIRMRLHVFGFGGLQIILTTGLISFFLIYSLKLDNIVATVIGAALALSSTAIVMQVLEENKRKSTQVGRLSISVLLMQDFAVVPLLAVLPILAAGDGGGENLMQAIGMATLKAFGAIIVITITGRLLLRPFFSIIGSVKTDEVYVTTALLIVLGASYTTSYLGLSAAMGAFLAGILIAETEYSNKIEDSITPFQGIFLALFFLTVGMSISLLDIIANFKKVIILSSILLFIKAFVVFILCKIFRFKIGASINAALLLSQGGEFAFILFGLASKQGVISEENSQLLLMIVALTMAITPLLSIIGAKIEDYIDSKEELDSSQEFKGISDLNDHVIIAGFGRVGRVVAHMLSEEKIDYIAIDNNAGLVKKAKERGFPIYHGDLASSDILKAVAASRAAAIVLSMSDKTSVRKAIALISKEFKKLPTIVRVEDFKHGRIMKKFGAKMTVPTTIETGMQLGTALLKDLNVPEHEIMSMKDKIRKNDYALADKM